MVLDASQARSGAGGAAEANGGAPHAAPGDAAELDLTGEREFLVAETAQDALASMLAPGASVSRVSLSRLDCGPCRPCARRNYAYLDAQLHWTFIVVPT